MSAYKINRAYTHRLVHAPDSRAVLSPSNLFDYCAATLLGAAPCKGSKDLCCCPSCILLLEEYAWLLGIVKATHYRNPIPLLIRKAFWSLKLQKPHQHGQALLDLKLLSCAITRLFSTLSCPDCRIFCSYYMHRSRKILAPPFPLMLGSQRRIAPFVRVCLHERF